MAIDIDARYGWRLAGDRSDPTVELAASELEAALGRPGDGGIEIELSHVGGSGDGYRRRVRTKRVELEGDSPRGLLFGVYRTLEELGLRWEWPGREPGPAGGAQLDELFKDAPALPGRCLALGERALLDDVEGWVIWAARNRLNTLFVHVGMGRNPVGAAPEGGVAGAPRARARACPGEVDEDRARRAPVAGVPAGTGVARPRRRRGPERGGPRDPRGARARAPRGRRPSPLGRRPAGGWLGRH